MIPVWLRSMADIDKALGAYNSLVLKYHSYNHPIFITATMIICKI